MYSQQISKLMDLLEKELGTRRIFRANQLELERRKLDQEPYKQRLINEGLANVEGVKNIGALARQRLMNESSSEVENIRGRYGIQGEQIRTAGQKDVEETRAGAQKYGSDQTLKGHEAQAAAHRYQADQMLKGHEATAEAHVRAAELGAEAKRPTPSELYIQSAGQFFDPAVFDTLRKREVGEPPLPEGDITAGGATAPPPVGTTTPPPAGAPSPARATLGKTAQPSQDDSAFFGVREGSILSRAQKALQEGKKRRKTPEEFGFTY